MRIINGLMFVVMICYVLVQYNDPDFYFWMPIYAVPAVWAALAAVRPSLLDHSLAKPLLGACVVAAVAGMFWFWPKEPDFWARDVWWNSETAREGMGMMSVLIVLLLVALTAWLRRGRALREERAA